MRTKIMWEAEYTVQWQCGRGVPDSHTGTKRFDTKNEALEYTRKTIDEGVEGDYGPKQGRNKYPRQEEWCNYGPNLEFEGDETSVYWETTPYGDYTPYFYHSIHVTPVGVDVWEVEDFLREARRNIDLANEHSTEKMWILVNLPSDPPLPKDEIVFGEEE